MARSKKQKELTPMQQAVRELFEVGACDASAEQTLATAQKYGVEVCTLEGLYFDAVARLEETDA
ncbi:hypothetical protein NDN94_07560 [Burkholderia glumae]|uniref:hypothetical protein n=1 Tax=Burkholderia glumae TaxID=337 RepID=UPI00203767BB|nr:hypothetical protein [Burkholderia glumae]MCM2537683.1 hypothetical protein [Burkholderia glumae]